MNLEPGTLFEKVVSTCILPLLTLRFLYLPLVLFTIPTNQEMDAQGASGRGGAEVMFVFGETSFLYLHKRTQLVVGTDRHNAVSKSR